MLRHLLIAAVLSCSYAALSEHARPTSVLMAVPGGQLDFRDWNRPLPIRVLSPKFLGTGILPQQ